MKWADSFAVISACCKRGHPRDAKVARMWCRGIGLCQFAEHMFFGEENLPHMQAMILARDEKSRNVKSCCPYNAKNWRACSRPWTGCRDQCALSIRHVARISAQREDLVVDRAAATPVESQRRDVEKYTIKVGV